MENCQEASKPEPAAAEVVPSLLLSERVLLVDTDPRRRKLRLASMTRAGLNVCCATDAVQARVMVRESPYALVLIDLPHDRDAALKLRADMNDDRPQQRIRFLVGKPSYLASNPLQQHESPESGPVDPNKRIHALISRTCERLPGRGRLLEAAWRMSFLRRQRRLPEAGRTPGETAQASFAAAVLRAEKDVEGPSASADAAFAAAVRSSAVSPSD